MKQKVRYIPTLQDYMKKRKKERTEFLDLNCMDCDYYRKGLEVCLWADNVKMLSMLKTCPVTYRVL
ncbi:MAG: hypothetical protein PHC34_00545 [Candidatus Gastranaerophilales bacterium]|nr:hypothetical protein [Candidatus Gastranaerophilales bacterium]